jgi:hypothetical protein
MTFQPGQSGNPAGNTGHSTRRKGTRLAFQAIEHAGYIDPLVNLAKIQHEGETEAIRTSAAAALVPYVHPKLQSIPVPRFIDRPFEIPVFKTIDDAKNFLATIPSKIAAGELDLDFADSLTKSTVAWLQLQFAEQGLDLKAAAQGASSGEQTIHILGGLPSLPLGPNDGPLIMPELNGKSYELVESSSPVAAPANESTPSPAEPQDPP